MRALVFVSLLSIAHTLNAAPVLQAADVRIVVTSPTTCEVWMRVTMDAVSEVDHRIEAFASSRIDLIDVQGATRIGNVRMIGRTQSLLLKTERSPYEINYRVQQTPDRHERCPLWLPAVATDGLSRAIQLRVELPSQAVPGHSMPALTWAGNTGSTVLRHLPAFVRVPYAAAGESPPWDLAGAMDAIAVTTIAFATVIWIWRRKG
jgi:hypothetical protein